MGREVNGSQEKKLEMGEKNKRQTEYPENKPMVTPSPLLVDNGNTAFNLPVL